MRRGATRRRVEAVTGEEPEARSRHAGIFRSPYPGIEIPEAPLTPFVLERAGELGDKPALVDGPTGRTISYSAFAGAVRRAAAGLAGRGFEKGAVLAIYSPNLPKYAVAVHAVASLGGVVTPANPLNTAGSSRASSTTRLRGGYSRCRRFWKRRARRQTWLACARSSSSATRRERRRSVSSSPAGGNRPRSG